MTALSGPPAVVSLAPATVAEACALMARAARFTPLVELRLDALDHIVPELARGTPVGVIATCRPVREGGRFRGSEAERIAILARAAGAGAAWIDIEWDSVEPMRAAAPQARLIVSRHWFGTMPDLTAEYRRLRDLGAVTKLAVAADNWADAAGVLDLLASATSPVIAMAMGPEGRTARLLGGAFAQSFTTYAAMEAGRETAPGQPTITEVQAVGARRPLVVVPWSRPEPPPPHGNGTVYWPMEAAARPEFLRRAEAWRPWIVVGGISTGRAE